MSESLVDSLGDLDFATATLDDFFADLDFAFFLDDVCEDTPDFLLLLCFVLSGVVAVCICRNSEGTFTGLCIITGGN